MSSVLSDLVSAAAAKSPTATALNYRGQKLAYGELAERVRAAVEGYLALGVRRGERIGVYLDKRFETVVAMFAAAAAGAVFVPINPLLKPRQVGHILRDCNVRVLVTATERARALAEELAGSRDLRHVVLVDAGADCALDRRIAKLPWQALQDNATASRTPHRVIDQDMAAIFYTSGSTGLPKGVVLSHRNLVAGANSVSQYLGNHAGDRILSALPLSFDAGFSQLTTAFKVGASVTLLNYLLPQDLVNTVVAEGITGLTAVPPLWNQVITIDWPEAARASMRYIANTGGAMPGPTLAKLRMLLPRTQVFLMYGLTEAFRSTYLPPDQVDRRPGSIGKAIPNAEILVVAPDGRICEPGESGELVHRGALVSLGYWNDPAKTAERFRPAPGQPSGLCLTEVAVWSGDTVRLDEEGYLYFVGRRDEMIKTSGYRVSPNEIEETIYASGLVGEVVALGVKHPTLAQAIVVLATPPANASRLDHAAVTTFCKREMPAYMVPQHIAARPSLPRNPNGKIDRVLLANEMAGLFMETVS
jgi:acyl-CoA ligase (AMP-forming) (exosortase A-associated)